MTGLLSKKSEIYADFRRDFMSSPVNSDLARKTNEDAISESIQNLILTNRGEALFDPLRGASINEFLFENMTPITVSLAKDRVLEVINRYESKRVRNVDVSIAAYYDTHEVVLTITYYPINGVEPKTVDVLVKRNR